MASKGCCASSKTEDVLYKLKKCTLETPEGPVDCECLCQCVDKTGKNCDNCKDCDCQCKCTLENARKVQNPDGSTFYQCVCKCSCKSQGPCTYKLKKCTVKTPDGNEIACDCLCQSEDCKNCKCRLEDAIKIELPDGSIRYQCVCKCSCKCAKSSTYKLRKCTMKTSEGNEVPCDCLCQSDNCKNCICSLEDAIKIEQPDGSIRYQCDCKCFGKCSKPSTYKLKKCTVKTPEGNEVPCDCLCKSADCKNCKCNLNDAIKIVHPDGSVRYQCICKCSGKCAKSVNYKLKKCTVKTPEGNEVPCDCLCQCDNCKNCKCSLENAMKIEQPDGSIRYQCVCKCDCKPTYKVKKCTLRTPNGEAVECECLCRCVKKSGQDCSDCKECVCKCNCTLENAKKIENPDGTFKYQCICECEC